MMSNAIAALALRLARPQRWRLYHEFIARERADLADARAYQAERLRALLGHLAAHVPFYGPHLAGLDLDREDPRAVLVGLPRVDKTAIREGGDAFLGDPAVSGDGVSMATGGSSGEVFRFRIGAGDRERRMAADMRSRAWAGWCLGGRMAQIWGHAGDVTRLASPAGRLRNALLHRSLIVNSFNLQVDEMAEHLDAIRRHRPRVLLGYASSLGFLAEAAGPGSRIPGLRGIISSAESLLPETRAVIEAAFGVPVHDRYGSREFGTIAQQCERLGGYHVSHDRLVVEVLDEHGKPCEPGRRGELVLTDLDNRVMPLVRYRTGDLATWAADPCPCGRTLPLLESVAGRVSDLLVGVNGRVVSCPGPTFFLAGNPGVRQLQIVQDVEDEIRLRVVPTEAWNQDRRDQVAARIRDLLGDLTVSVELVEEILPTASGKYRFTLSQVSPFRSRT